MSAVSVVVQVPGDLWAMMMEVLPLVAWPRAFMMLFSVMESREEVASSKTRVGQFLRM